VLVACYLPLRAQPFVLTLAMATKPAAIPGITECKQQLLPDRCPRWHAAAANSASPIAVCTDAAAACSRSVLMRDRLKVHTAAPEPRVCSHGDQELCASRCSRTGVRSIPMRPDPAGGAPRQRRSAARQPHTRGVSLWSIGTSTPSSRKHSCCNLSTCVRIAGQAARSHGFMLGADPFLGLLTAFHYAGARCQCPTHSDGWLEAKRAASESPTDVAAWLTTWPCCYQSLERARPVQ